MGAHEVTGGGEEGFLDLVVAGLASGGDGVAKVDEKTLFLPGTLPGDCVRIQLAALERLGGADGRRVVQMKWGEAEVVRPSVERTPAACPLFGRCGGCQWLNASHGLQLRHKDGEFRRLLAEALGDEALEAVLPMASVEPVLGYRRRVALHASKGRLGLARLRSDEIIPFEGCALLMPSLDSCAARVSASCEGKGMPKGCSDVAITVDDGNRAVAAFHFASAPGKAALKRVEDVSRMCGLSGSVACVDGKVAMAVGRPLVSLDAPGCAGRAKLHLRADLFAQAHREAGRVLSEAVLGHGECAGQDVLELHGGNGTFTLALASEGRAASVTSVEICGPALALARKSASEAGLSNVRCVEGDAVRTAVELGRSGERFPVMVLDPPRGGAKGVASAAAAVGARRVVYVSCNPETLALDAKALSREGYRLSYAQGFDLFPQTGHMEAVATFSLRGEP